MLIFHKYLSFCIFFSFKLMLFMQEGALKPYRDDITLTTPHAMWPALYQSDSIPNLVWEQNISFWMHTEGSGLFWQFWSTVPPDLALLPSRVSKPETNIKIKIGYFVWVFSRGEGGWITSSPYPSHPPFAHRQIWLSAFAAAEKIFLLLHAKTWDEIEKG